MMLDLVFLAVITLSFLPFFLLIWLNGKANLKKPVRVQQVFMPVIALVYCVAFLLAMESLQNLLVQALDLIADKLAGTSAKMVSDWLKNMLLRYTMAFLLVLFNTLMLLIYLILKKILCIFFKRIRFAPESVLGTLVKGIYTYDREEDIWYVKQELGQTRSFFKIAYYGGTVLLVLIMLLSCTLAKEGKMTAPYYPAFAIIFLGELFFFLDGLVKGELESSLSVTADQSQRVAMYPLLRNPLRTLLDDKLSSEGTTVNNTGMRGGSVEDILVNIERDGTHLSRNYSAFIRKKMDEGFKPHPDYIRSGYELASGKSLLFNTPFYYKLQPYAFYAMNRQLLEGRKVLIVLGRHGTETDLEKWCRQGMEDISNVPNLWNIARLSEKEKNEDEIPDIGIISCSGVHDLNIHKANLPFLKMVGFVMIVEPSRLVTTAQIGLHLLVKNLGEEQITYCSVDCNCDGLVDTLSHILMANLTEVAATEFPPGMSSYMCWTADDEYVQHRLIPGISRYLGMGTELSFIALKNQVKTAIWYGGDSYPVLDAHWIAKQYYHDLLEYAGLPGVQETFDTVFQTSFNMCDQRVCDFAYVSVEDDRNNLFEIRRNFATIARQQGFVNVISSEYMLREYMAENTQLFTADPKAIPYLAADFARTIRNSILRICLKLCLDGMLEEVLQRELMLIGVDSDEPDKSLWREICKLLGCNTSATDNDGNPILLLSGKGSSQTISLEKKNTLTFSRKYSVEHGRFVGVFTIENQAFGEYILEDLQNATYVAEQDRQDCYLGTELKGHIYQKYLPGQFFTLNGKYYEMVGVATGNRILVRRASEYISGRLAFRQVRNYTISRLENSQAMGDLKTINGILIYNQFADFSVATSGYWRLQAYNAFHTGSLIELNGIPTREYHNKQILRLDFSQLGDGFTDEIRVTLTNLLNEVFVTLFADNAPFISAVTPGEHKLPLTYHLHIADSEENLGKSIFIVEDSQLDLGLLIAVERNINRILQIISDYLAWNQEQIVESQKAPEPKSEKQPFSPYESAEQTSKKKNILARFFGWIKSLFIGKKNQPVNPDKAEKKKEKRSFLTWLKELFGRKKNAVENVGEQPQEQQETPGDEGAIQDDGAQETAQEPNQEETGVTLQEPNQDEISSSPSEACDEELEGQTESDKQALGSDNTEDSFDATDEAVSPIPEETEVKEHAE